MILTQVVKLSAPLCNGKGEGGAGAMGNWSGVLLKVEGRCIKQDFIPYVGQLDIANNPTEGWIINLDVHGLLAGSCDVVSLPSHYGKVIHPGVMACGIGMVIGGRRDPKMFLEPFPRGSCRFPYILLNTLRPVTFIPVDYSTFYVMLTLPLGAPGGF